MVGERSALDDFDSTWTGVFENAEYAEWRVVGWTGETPNLKKSQTADEQGHSFAQFNSAHQGGLTIFAFADGRVQPIRDSVNFELFESLGTISGREQISIADMQ